MKKLLYTLLSFSLLGSSSDKLTAAMPPAKVFAGVQTGIQRDDKAKLASRALRRRRCGLALG